MKHLSNRRKIKRIDPVSSGERKRDSPNHLDLSERGCRATTWKAKVRKTVWKVRPKRVIAPYPKTNANLVVP